jgi:hypothetical protein
MNMKKPSKNTKCPCGSGKKFKKCCGSNAWTLGANRKIAITQPPPAVVAEAMRKFKEQTEKHAKFQEKYGHARVPVVAPLGDKWFVAVGNSIYKQTQDEPYTFLHVIHDHALLLLGHDFLNIEESKDLGLRHPAVQWMNLYVEHQNKTFKMELSDPRRMQIGSGAAWFRLAYDLFTIGDNAKLEERMIRRLRDQKTFQAARHELKIAALCVVAGFDIAFEDEENNSSKHPEFIATDRISGIKIAVEVKSRHRRGVQGFSDGPDINPGDRVNIRKQVVEAYKKKPNLPYYVFVDTNLPPVADETVWTQWIGEIGQTMADLKAEGYDAPCAANAVFFSNDPSHYLLEEKIGGPEDHLWIRPFISEQPRFPHPVPSLVERFIRAHAQRLAPPADFSEFYVP